MDINNQMLLNIILTKKVDDLRLYLHVKDYKID